VPSRITRQPLAWFRACCPPGPGRPAPTCCCEVYRTHLRTYLEALLRNVDEWAGPSSHRPAWSKDAAAITPGWD